MDLKPIPSGVGLLTGRIGNVFSSIENYFPLPLNPPKRFEKPFYPRFTDSLFIRAIYELANRTPSLKDLSRTASFHRLDDERLRGLLSEDVRSSFIKLEPQFKQFPGVIENFMAAAGRYTAPFPEFEIDMAYGEADLYQDRKLIEMKSYSVMTMQDLIHARNQVLLYACLARHTGNFFKPIEKLEVINALTNESWIWDFTEFSSSGESERFYWCVIEPMIANNNLSDEEIHGIRNLYEQNVNGMDLMCRIIKDKYSKIIFNLQRKLKDKERQLKLEAQSRRMIIKRRNGLMKTKELIDIDVDYESIHGLFN